MRALVGLLVLSSCVTVKAPPSPVAPAPTLAPAPQANALRVRALPFDVSACAKPNPPPNLTAETLAAFLEVERPRFEACLASPSSREKDDATADVEVQVAAAVTARVTPRNVSAEGVRCLEARAKALALNRGATPLIAVLVVTPPAGAPPPTLELVPEVTLLRATVTQACGCFDALGVNAPPQLVLRHLSGSPVDVVTTDDPLAERMERCLEAALQGHPSAALELIVDLPLLNGDATQPSPDAVPDVVAAQTEAMHRRHRAKALLLVARRAALQQALEPVASAYKRKPTPKLAQRRVALCDELRAVAQELPDVLARANDPALAQSTSLEVTALCASVKPRAVEADQG